MSTTLMLVCLFGLNVSKSHVITPSEAVRMTAIYSQDDGSLPVQRALCGEVFGADPIDQYVEYRYSNPTGELSIEFSDRALARAIAKDAAYITSKVQ